VINEEAIKEATTAIIKAIGEDPEREGLANTPQRVAEMYNELFSGMGKDPLYSMCEHHLLPFFGVVHIGYIPDITGRVVGISKLARVVEIVARRPQIQERMTTQIADAIVDGINPQGVAVVVQGEHMCMVMRGVKKPGSNFSLIQSNKT